MVSFDHALKVPQWPGSKYDFHSNVGTDFEFYASAELPLFCGYPLYSCGILSYNLCPNHLKPSFECPHKIVQSVLVYKVSIEQAAWS